ncbi:hypothetical protein [Xylophilus sp.]|uniref:hypothetical protein n=1 Tax=Xylophilus sp. TaxID=2653893 RepID=UPI002D7E9244|nr:hypothetical protein [Xylophilus sp.]
MTVGDLATWFGGLASAAAAFAALRAAKNAVAIAQVPAKQAADDRARTASIFAKPLIQELSDIRDRASKLPNEIESASTKGPGSVIPYIERQTLNPMLALSQAMPFIDCFGPESAALLISVIAAKGAYQDRVSRLIAMPRPSAYGVGMMKAVGEVKECATELHLAAEKAITALETIIS